MSKRKIFLETISFFIFVRNRLVLRINDIRSMSFDASDDLNWDNDKNEIKLNVWLLYITFTIDWSGIGIEW